jgi:hypothetical protein
VLNPGCIYYTTRFHATSESAFDRVKADWREIDQLTFRDIGHDAMPWGYFQLFNKKASSLAGRKALISEAWPTAGTVDRQFMELWPRSKRVKIDDHTRCLSVVHIWHGDWTDSWSCHGQSGRWRFAGQTAGTDSEGNPPTTKVVYWARQPELPSLLLLQRIDTEESIIVEAHDLSAVNEWLAGDFHFDVYWRDSCG